MVRTRALFTKFCPPPLCAIKNHRQYSVVGLPDIRRVSGSGPAKSTSSHFNSFKLNHILNLLNFIFFRKRGGISQNGKK